MKSKSMLCLSIMIVAGLFSLWGCPKKMEVASAPESQKEAVTAPSTPEVTATQAAPAAASESGESEERATVSGAGLKMIFFDFDKAFIRDDARPVMKANAEWLKAHPNAKVMIEGACDERGTIEYNQALGQRRAASAKKYLTDVGVSSSRISMISYGKEKPACTDHNEPCWQKNRRDDLVENKE
jgi:peptidoglycan-associated lipoprotein